MAMKINQERLLAHLEELGKIGYSEGYGRTRISYTPEYDEGRNLVEGYMKAAGLETYVDEVGNLFGVKKGKSDRVILVGSHIDTVPEAGMYDGCLGVLGAVEALQTMEENGYTPNHTLKVAAWIDEEGTGIGGLFGSRAYAGLAIDAGFRSRFDQCGMTMEKFHASKSDDAVDYYLELHIEQGGILDDKKVSIGVVQAIVGIFRWTVTMNGMANHAGSTPMYLRDDAMVKTAAFITRYDELVRSHPGMVGTVGKLEAFPGTFNIIPGKVVFTAEMRSVNLQEMEQVWQAMLDEFGGQFTFEQDFRQEETIMDDAVKEAISDAADRLGLSVMPMNSGAGHDTQSIAAVTKPGMIFVPSIGGISHSPLEKTSRADCANGANVLLGAICRLD